MKNLPRSKFGFACCWLIWAAPLVQQWSIHGWRVNGPWLADNPTFPRPVFIGMLLPLLASIIIRWFVLPRIKMTATAFVVFFSGIFLATLSAFFAGFLELPCKGTIYLASILAVVEFVPLRFGVAAKPHHPTSPPPASPPADQPPRKP